MKVERKLYLNANFFAFYRRENESSMESSDEKWKMKFFLVFT